MTDMNETSRADKSLINAMRGHSERFAPHGATKPVFSPERASVADDLLRDAADRIATLSAEVERLTVKPAHVEQRLMALEKHSHEPFELTHLIERLDRLEANISPSSQGGKTMTSSNKEVEANADLWLLTAGPDGQFSKVVSGFWNLSREVIASVFHDADDDSEEAQDMRRRLNTLGDWEGDHWSISWYFEDGYVAVQRITDAYALSDNPASSAHDDVPVGGRKVPEGQTPLDDKLNHRYLDVIREGEKARDAATSSPYHGHSLEDCLHAIGWVKRDLRLALDTTSRREGE